MIQWMLAIWSLAPLPFLNPAWTSENSWFMYCWSIARKILSITLLACEMSAIVLCTFFGIAFLWDWNENWPFLKFILFYFLTFNIVLAFHIPTWISHRYTRVPYPELSSLLPPHTIPLGHPSAPAPGIQYRASNLEWQLISYMILYMFQCHSSKSSHPHPLPQSPKDCSIHQCLFCCLVYRAIVTIFLNSIYMR